MKYRGGTLRNRQSIRLPVVLLSVIGLMTLLIAYSGSAAYAASYNRNLWMHHLNGDAAYLPV
jgi:hypothetical protein